MLVNLLRRRCSRARTPVQRKSRSGPDLDSCKGTRDLSRRAATRPASRSRSKAACTARAQESSCPHRTARGLLHEFLRSGEYSVESKGTEFRRIELFSIHHRCGRVVDDAVPGPVIAHSRAHPRCRPGGSKSPRGSNRLNLEIEVSPRIDGFMRLGRWAASPTPPQRAARKRRRALPTAPGSSTPSHCATRCCCG